MRRARVPALLVAVVAAFGGDAARAQNWDCTDPYVLPQQGINFCLATEYVRADAELNDVYGQAMATLEPEMAGMLREAQRAWIPFRDAACDVEAALMLGGSGEPMLRYGCLIRLTERRTGDMRGLMGINQ